MYKIIGGDQKEYGPVTFDQLAAWIRDNRANGQTLVQKEGGPWLPLSAVPEFATLLGAQAAAVPPATASADPAVPAGSSGGFGTETPGPGSSAPSLGGGAFYQGNDLDLSERARQQVQGPATALLVSGIIGAVTVLIGVVLGLMGNAFQPPPGQLPPEMQQFMNTLEVFRSPLYVIIDGVIKLGISGLIIFGAQKLRALEGFGLVVTAAILGMVPCTAPCCCVGLPIGIWVLTAMFKPEVKGQFH